MSLLSAKFFKINRLIARKHRIDDGAARTEHLCQNTFGSRLISCAKCLSSYSTASYRQLALLVTLPYLTATLGPYKWARLAWMQVILGYFVIVVDWGFSWHGTAHIAQFRSDVMQRSRAFFAGWAVQWLVMLVAVILLIMLHYFADFYADFRDFTFWGCLFVVSSMLFPGWFPGGLERLREVALVQFAVRAGSVPLVFFTVQDKSDGPMAIASLAIAAMISGAIGLVWIFRNVEIAWKMPHKKDFKLQIFNGGSVLQSRLSMILYTTLIPTILGVMISATAVGHYMIADRIRSGILSLVNPIAQALLPRMSFLYTSDKHKDLQLIIRSYLLLGSITFFIGIMVFVFLKQIVFFIGRDGFEDTATVFMWFSFIPFIAIFSIIMGIQILIPKNMSNIYNRVLIFTGAIGFFFAVVIIKYFGTQDADIAMFVSKAFIIIVLALYIWKNRERLFG